jgi:hypothetical protein
MEVDKYEDEELDVVFTGIKLKLVSGNIYKVITSDETDDETDDETYNEHNNDTDDEN